MLVPAGRGALQRVPLSAGSHQVLGRLPATASVQTLGGSWQVGTADSGSESVRDIVGSHDWAADQAGSDSDTEAFPHRRSVYAYCPAGTHLARAEWPSEDRLRVVVYQNAQLTHSFEVPVSATQSLWHMQLTAGAEIVALSLRQYAPRSLRVDMLSRTGAVLASHQLPALSEWRLGPCGRFMLALTGDMTALHVCASARAVAHVVQLGTHAEVPGPSPAAYARYLSASYLQAVRKRSITAACSLLLIL